MKILLTGASGYLGQALIPWLLEKYNPEVIRLFSRNDWRMAQILRQYNDLYTFKRFRPLIGDACDRERVMSVTDGVDLVICAHAMKRIEIANYCPQEAVKVNVLSVMNCMDAAIAKKVSKFVFISSDKAYHAENLYGKTKACSEAMIIERARELNESNPVMTITRYGNVIGSTGAVLPYWIQLAKENKPLPLTDDRMTRFLVTRRIALNTVGEAITSKQQGEIFYPCELYSVKMLDAANWINKYFNNENEEEGIKIIGMFSGEKLHEELDQGISSDKFLIGEKQFFELLKEDNLL